MSRVQLVPLARRAFVVPAAVAGAASAAAAQSTAPDRLARDTAALRPVVVTATRVALALPVQTAGVTVLQGADLRARGIVSVAQALREVPGAAVVQSGSTGGVTSLFLRGGESRYTKVLIDGVPANQPGGSFDFAFLTTDNVERIEVVRGPASVLYGSDAMSGVVQVFTRGGRGPASPRLMVRGGTYGTVDAEAGVQGGSARAGYSLDLAHHVTAGLYGDSSVVLPAGRGTRTLDHTFRNSVASGAVRLAPDAASDVRLAARFSDGRYAFPTDGNGAVNPLQNAARGRPPHARLARRRPSRRPGARGPPAAHGQRAAQPRARPAHGRVRHAALLLGGPRRDPPPGRRRPPELHRRRRGRAHRRRRGVGAGTVERGRLELALRHHAPALLGRAAQHGLLRAGGGQRRRARCRTR
jgi:outer membrane receptor protein involved in Fe transport